MTIKRDIGDFTTDDDGTRDGKELVATIRKSLLALWGFHAGTLINVAGTNIITASVEVTQGLTALTDGLNAILVPVNTNTGAVEIDVAGLGRKPVKSASGQALSAGTLVAGTRSLLLFDSDHDHWWVFGSSGTTNVSVTGGLQVKRSEPVRLIVEAGPTTEETILVSRRFQCTYSTSRVILEGAVSRVTGANETDTGDTDTGDTDTGPANDETVDPDPIDTRGLSISLYKDGVLVEIITDAAVVNTHTVTPFYFSHLPGDTDAHTYEIRVGCTIAATYPVSGNWMVATEMTPN